MSNEDEIEVHGDDTSTAVKVLLAELASSDSDDNKDVTVETEEDTTVEEDEQTNNQTSNSPLLQDEEDSDMLEGISVDTSETEEDRNVSEEPTERQSLVFIEKKNFTRGAPFRPEDSDDEGKTFPINASGQIDSVFISAAQNSFSVYLELDGDKVLDDIPWTELESYSSELAHVGAYERADGSYVVSISDYPFSDKVDLSVTPTEDTDFNAVRAEVMVDYYTTGED